MYEGSCFDWNTDSAVALASLTSSYIAVLTLATCVKSELNMH
jgi:hypothetical protein